MNSIHTPAPSKLAIFCAGLGRGLCVWFVEIETPPPPCVQYRVKGYELNSYPLSFEMTVGGVNPQNR